jgi:hypothetical protein
MKMKELIYPYFYEQGVMQNHTLYEKYFGTHSIREILSGFGLPANVPIFSKIKGIAYATDVEDWLFTLDMTTQQIEWQRFVDHDNSDERTLQSPPLIRVNIGVLARAIVQHYRDVYNDNTRGLVMPEAEDHDKCSRVLYIICDEEGNVLYEVQKSPEHLNTKGYVLGRLIRCPYCDFIDGSPMTDTEEIASILWNTLSQTDPAHALLILMNE